MLETGIIQRHKPAFVQRHHQRRAVLQAESPAAAPQGRLPRSTRLMALAIRFEQLLASGAVRDQAELAEVGHVTRARVTQIMNMLHLAPYIQEELLALPPIDQGRDRITERHVRAVVAHVDWHVQRALWQQLRVRC